MANKNAKTYWIADRRQIAALGSPMRQEIVDVVAAAGPCSIAQLAAALGYPPDRLYFHVRRLENVRLLKRRGVTGNGREAAVLYDVPERTLRIRYDRRERRMVQALCAVHDGVMRLARRDLRRAMISPASIVDGSGRDTWAGRSRGWLTPAQIQRLNQLINEMTELVRNGTIRKGAKPIAFTFVLAPPRVHRTPRKSLGARK